MVAKIKKIKKKGYQDAVFSFIIVALFMGTTSFFVYSNWNINKKRQEMTTRIEELKKEIQMLEEKNNKLAAGIAQSQDEYYLEEKAREQGYKKPGEEAVVVLPSQSTTQGQAVSQQDFWQKVKGFFQSFASK